MRAVARSSFRSLLGAMLLVAGTSVQAQTPLQRGGYLVDGIGSCGNCHSPQAPDGTPDGPPLSGGPAIATPAFTAYAPNLTSDAATGIGGWTEQQIVTALRDGLTPAGTVLRPPMPIPFYRQMSDADARAIAVYLRSLPATVHRVPASTWTVPTPAGYGPPVAGVAAPDAHDPVAAGEYLARIGHCMLCHTPNGPGGQRDYAHRLGAGGAPMLIGGVRRPTPNITPDRDTGIGGWSDAQIAAALTTGMRPDGRMLAPPMPWRYLAHMEAADVAALVAYLRSVPAIRNRVE